MYKEELSYEGSAPLRLCASARGLLGNIALRKARRPKAWASATQTEGITAPNGRVSDPNGRLGDPKLGQNYPNVGHGDPKLGHSLPKRWAF
jgi:hypothetical protein